MQPYFHQAGLAGLGPCVLPTQMVIPTIRSWTVQTKCHLFLELDGSSEFICFQPPSAVWSPPYCPWINFHFLLDSTHEERPRSPDSPFHLSTARIFSVTVGWKLFYDTSCHWFKCSCLSSWKINLVLLQSFRYLRQLPHMPRQNIPRSFSSPSWEIRALIPFRADSESCSN